MYGGHLIPYLSFDVYHFTYCIPVSILLFIFSLLPSSLSWTHRNCTMLSTTSCVHFTSFPPLHVAQRSTNSRSRADLDLFLSTSCGIHIVYLLFIYCLFFFILLFFCTSGSSCFLHSFPCHPVPSSAAPLAAAPLPLPMPSISVLCQEDPASSASFPSPRLLSALCCEPVTLRRSFLVGRLRARLRVHRGLLQSPCRVQLADLETVVHRHMPSQTWTCCRSSSSSATK